MPAARRVRDHAPPHPPIASGSSHTALASFRASPALLPEHSSPSPALGRVLKSPAGVRAATERPPVHRVRTNHPQARRWRRPHRRRAASPPAPLGQPCRWARPPTRCRGWSRRRGGRRQACWRWWGGPRAAAAGLPGRTAGPRVRPAVGGRLSGWLAAWPGRGMLRVQLALARASNLCPDGGASFAAAFASLCAGGEGEGERRAGVLAAFCSRSARCALSARV